MPTFAAKCFSPSGAAPLLYDHYGTFGEQMDISSTLELICVFYPS